MQPANDAPATKFATPDEVRFVFERRGRLGLLQFEGEGEIYALTLSQGPGGDELFKTDTGQVMVRLTGYGGMTVYRPADRVGAPAAATGAGRPFSEPVLSPPAARARIETVQMEVSRGLSRQVTFEAAPDAASAGLMANAAERAALGLQRGAVVRVHSVRIVVGPAPHAALTPDGALRVAVTPSLGLAGAPSSEAVRKAAQGR